MSVCGKDSMLGGAEVFFVSGTAQYWCPLATPLHIPVYISSLLNKNIGRSE